jgi:hypothetical protein
MYVSFTPDDHPSMKRAMRKQQQVNPEFLPEELNDAIHTML